MKEIARVLDLYIHMYKMYSQRIFFALIIKTTIIILLPDGQIRLLITKPSIEDTTYVSNELNYYCEVYVKIEEYLEYSKFVRYEKIAFLKKRKTVDFSDSISHVSYQSNYVPKQSQ